jgi:hypothetical protein
MQTGARSNPRADPLPDQAAKTESSPGRGRDWRSGRAGGTSSGSIPYSFAVSTIRNSDGVNGIDISYSAETARPRLDVPGRFLHFDVQTSTAHDVLPAGVRPAMLGGKRGLLAPAEKPLSRNPAGCERTR